MTHVPTGPFPSSPSHKPWYKEPGWWSLALTFVIVIVGAVFTATSGALQFYFDMRKQIDRGQQTYDVATRTAERVTAIDRSMTDIESKLSDLRGRIDATAKGANSGFTSADRERLRISSDSIEQVQKRVASLELDRQKAAEQFAALREAVRALANTK